MRQSDTFFEQMSIFGQDSSAGGYRADSVLLANLRVGGNPITRADEACGELLAETTCQLVAGRLEWIAVGVRFG